MRILLKICFALVLSLSSFGHVNMLQAQGQFRYTPLAPIPGVTDAFINNQSTTGSDSGQAVKDLIGKVFKFGVGLCSALAVIMIIYGGFLYVMGAASESNISKGREVIQGAITGLVLVLCIVIILKAVNNSLLSGDLFDDLRVQSLTINPNSVTIVANNTGNTGPSTGVWNPVNTSASGTQVVTNPGTTTPSTLPPGQGGASTSTPVGAIVNSSTGLSTQQFAPGNVVYTGDKGVVYDAAAPDVQWMRVSKPSENGQVFLATNEATGKSILLTGFYLSDSQVPAGIQPYAISDAAYNLIDPTPGDTHNNPYTVRNTTEKLPTPPPSGPGN